MKKLIIALSVAVAAITLNAATVQWNSGVMTLASGASAKGAGKGAVLGYLWESTSSTIYDKVVAGTLNVAQEFEKTGYGELGAATLAGVQSSNTSGKANMAGKTSVDSPAGLYAVILYVDTTATGANKYIVNHAYSGDVGTTGVTVDELANYVGGKIGTTIQGEAISGWSSASVPEPTSGLLMLLGMAGLALRRRRA